MILRSTELKERPLAVALNSVISRLTGGLPAPLIFGLLLDKLCLVYSSETCTGGACLLTDHKRVRYLCTIVAVSFKVVSSIFCSWPGNCTRGAPPREGGLHLPSFYSRQTNLLFTS